VVEPDVLIAEWSARLLTDSAAMRALVVALSESNLTKALLFAPLLLVAWYGQDGSSRAKVLSVMVSCGLALVMVWLLTTTWRRPRPVDPRSGHGNISAVFLPHLTEESRRFEWGCFPSDHAAYLTALSLGLLCLSKRVGCASLIVSVGINGFLRLAVGLHYLSDVAVGFLFGSIAHWLVFCAIVLPRRPVAARIQGAVERSRLLQALLILGIIEMSVFFRDIRFLDDLLFGPLIGK